MKISENEQHEEEENSTKLPRILTLVILVCGSITFLIGVARPDTSIVRYDNQSQNSNRYQTMNLFKQCSHDTSDGQISCVPHRYQEFKSPIKLFAVQTSFVLLTFCYLLLSAYYEFRLRKSFLIYMDILTGLINLGLHFSNWIQISVTFNSFLQCVDFMQGYSLIFGGCLTSCVAYCMLIFIGTLPLLAPLFVGIDEVISSNFENPLNQYNTTQLYSYQPDQQNMSFSTQPAISSFSTQPASITWAPINNPVDMRPSQIQFN